MDCCYAVAPINRVFPVAPVFVSGSRLVAGVSQYPNFDRFGPIRHHPEAVLDYSVDWSGWLLAGDTIDSVAVAADNAVVDSHAVTGNVVRAVISGAIPLSECDVTFSITTVAGLADYRVVALAVSAGNPLASGPSMLDGGTPLAPSNFFIDGGGVITPIANFYDGGTPS